MIDLKIFATSCAAVLLLTTAASALTVKNTSDKEIAIGVDRGAEENVQ